MKTAEERLIARKEHDKAHRAKHRNYRDAVKMAIGCEICGYNEHPTALQFDHIDPATKSFPVARSKEHSWDKLIKEIAKCRVLCANCHMIHTHAE